MGKPTGLAKEQRRTLGRLKALLGVDRFYLAGGSAVAVHLDHRRSFDLDLFSSSGDVDLAAISRRAPTVLPDVKILGVTDASIRMVTGGVPVDVVRYPYPPLERPAPGPEGFPVAQLLDLAVMKLAAVARRGLRRDFWDLYAIIESGITLREVTEAYLKRFGLAEPDLYHVLRALTYFDDAERDPVFPKGLGPRRWERIKAFFEAEAPRLLSP